jgi:hypothetical protein
MEGGEELLSWSWSFEARTATTATRRGSDRGAATTTRLLLRPVLVLRPAIGEGMLVDDAMKQRVMSSERKREKERPSEREAREKMLVSKSLSIVTPTWLIFFFRFRRNSRGNQGEDYETIDTRLSISFETASFTSSSACSYRCRSPSRCCPA